MSPDQFGLVLDRLSANTLLKAVIAAMATVIVCLSNRLDHVVDSGPIADVEMKQLLRGRGLGQYVDRMTHRVDHVDSRFAGMRWGIVEGSST